ncbi:hypothetical protein K456DRAFT_1928051 [Colletotrichum gloeosporioides 23]|nr:hypothetical protein K456DRAFT_1928051 [Colletotrichum gloeosporioides 23]
MFLAVCSVRHFPRPPSLALQNHLGTLFPPSCLSRRLFSYSSIPSKTSPTASPPPVDRPLFLAAAVQPSNHHAHVSHIVVDLPPPASGICLRRELPRLSAPRQPLSFPSRVYPAARPGATSETVAFGPAHSRLIGRGGLCTEGNNNARIYIHSLARPPSTSTSAPNHHDPNRRGTLHPNRTRGTSHRQIHKRSLAPSNRIIGEPQEPFLASARSHRSRPSPTPEVNLETSHRHVLWKKRGNLETRPSRRMWR